MTHVRNIINSGHQNCTVHSGHPPTWVADSTRRALPSMRRPSCARVWRNLQAKQLASLGKAKRTAGHTQTAGVTEGAGAVRTPAPLRRFGAIAGVTATWGCGALEGENVISQMFPIAQSSMSGLTPRRFLVSAFANPPSPVSFRLAGGSSAGSGRARRRSMASSARRSCATRSSSRARTCCST